MKPDDLGLAPLLPEDAIVVGLLELLNDPDREGDDAREEDEHADGRADGGHVDLEDVEAAVSGLVDLVVDEGRGRRRRPGLGLALAHDGEGGGVMDVLTNRQVKVD